MCLGVPGRITELLNDDPLLPQGWVDFSGVRRKVNLAYLPEAKVGDYIVVHVGFGLSIIDEAQALRVYEDLRVLRGQSDK